MTDTTRHRDSTCDVPGTKPANDSTAMALLSPSMTVGAYVLPEDLPETVAAFFHAHAILTRTQAVTFLDQWLADPQVAATTGLTEEALQAARDLFGALDLSAMTNDTMTDAFEMPPSGIPLEPPTGARLQQKPLPFDKKRNNEGPTDE